MVRKPASAAGKPKGKRAYPRPTGKPAGRPTDYSPALCQAVIDDMAQGYSLTAFAGSIGVCRKTITNWMTAHEEFADAVACAQAIRLRKWEGVAWDIAKSGTGGPGASSVVIFALKNAGKGEWEDASKHLHSNPNGGPIEMVTRIELVDGSAPDDDGAG